MDNLVSASIIIRVMFRGAIERLLANPFWTLVAGVLIGLAAAGVIVVLSRAPRGHAIELLPAETDRLVTVHVSGAVFNPGLYEMAAGSRTLDAIDAAGGALSVADIGRVNLALELRDGQQVYVPTALEAGARGGFPININLAEVDELTELPGIGPVSAQAIVDYRFENGPFASIEEIMDVPGIGNSTFEEIKELIDIQG